MLKCEGGHRGLGLRLQFRYVYVCIYLTDDTRQRHSYYRRRIGNRTHAIEWHQFQ